jgi:pimeloyl-ACP methyl ester carboxylesterase
METIAVRGAQLSTLALGPDHLPTVAMLHGLVSGNMASWYSSIASKLAAERRVLLYDQRGHGASTLSTTGFDLDSQAEDLDQVLTHYDFATKPIDLVGHSMGALIALHFALARPERIRRLVLVDAPMPACEYVGPSLRGVQSREVLNSFIEQHMGAGLSGRRLERLRQRLGALFFETSLLSDVFDMEAEPDEALAAFDRPVLLLYGRNSPCVAAGHHLRRLLPQAELHLLEGGHYLTEEAPDLLCRHIQQFLSRRVAIRSASPGFHAIEAQAVP